LHSGRSHRSSHIGGDERLAIAEAGSLPVMYSQATERGID
jgi:hypothetical protein